MRESTNDKVEDLLYKIFFVTFAGLGATLCITYYKVFDILSQIGVSLVDVSAYGGM